MEIIRDKRMKTNLNELTFDNIVEWPLATKYYIASLLAAIVIGIGYWVVIKPEFEQYNTLSAHEKILKTDFELKQKQAVNFSAYKHQLAIMNERVENALKQLPAQNEIPALLNDISTIGLKNGLTLELLVLLPEVNRDFYVELPIQMVVQGNYHQLAMFISRIAEMTRLVTLHDFDIVMFDNQQVTGTMDLLEMKITAKIYQYKTT